MIQHPGKIRRWLALYQERRPARRALVITAVGGGGKTTILHYLYEHYRAAGLRVALTTTCKMGWQPGFIQDEAEIRAAAARGGCMIGIRADQGHAKGLEPEALWALLPLFDVVLIEGDGAKRLPLKVPLDHEPVIPCYSDLTLVLAGLSALHHPLQDRCFRLDRALALLGASAERMIDAAVMANLIRLGYLENPALAAHMQPDRCIVLLNQCDSAEKLRAFLEIRAQLQMPAWATHAPRRSRGNSVEQMTRWWIS